MNKKIVYFLMLALSVSLFSACSDDDDDDKVDDYAQQIAATYNGDLTVKMGTTELPAIKKDIKVSRTDLNKAKVEVDELKIPTGVEGVDLTVTGIAVEDIAVAKSGEEIKLAQKTADIKVKVDGVETDATVTISGTYVSNKLKLQIGVTGIPVEVSASFEGAKK